MPLTTATGLEVSVVVVVVGANGFVVKLGSVHFVVFLACVVVIGGFFS